jgi:uncharacterized cupin superfamily protein
MVPESPLAQTEHGLEPAGNGWFVVNARDAPWVTRADRVGYCQFEGFQGQADFSQVGINISFLAPGEPMAMYHYENDQEDFLVLAGEALLIVEGEERKLRQWDFFHCPPGTNHVIVGAGDERCVVVAVGSREHWGTSDWGAYTVDDAALRHDAGVTEETTDATEAYARFPPSSPTPYRDGWLPG